jgi:hypothetical protein
VAPLAVVNSLLRRDLHVVDEAMLPYFQDVYDHVLRASEWTESLRDLVTTVFETHLTVRGNRLNVIMKQDQLGGDHRGADGGDRVLWAERALSRVRHARGVLDLDPGHHRPVGGAVCGVPPQGLALTSPMRRR